MCIESSHPNPKAACIGEWFTWDGNMAELLKTRQTQLAAMARQRFHLEGPKHMGMSMAENKSLFSKTESQTQAEILKSRRQSMPATSTLGAQTTHSPYSDTPIQARDRVGGETRRGVVPNSGRDSLRANIPLPPRNIFERREQPPSLCDDVERTFRSEHPSRASRSDTTNRSPHERSFPRTREQAPSPPQSRTPEIPRRTVTTATILEQRPKPSPLSLNRSRENINLDTARARFGTPLSSNRGREQVDEDFDMVTSFDSPTKKPVMARKQGYVQQIKDKTRADENVNTPRARAKIFDDQSHEDKENNIHRRVNTPGSINSTPKPAKARQNEITAVPVQTSLFIPTETVTRGPSIAATKQAVVATSSGPAPESINDTAPTSNLEPKGRAINEVQKRRARKVQRRTALTGTKYFFALRGDVVAMQSHRNIAYKRAKVAMKMNASREKRTARQRKKMQLQCKQAQDGMKKMSLNEPDNKNEATDSMIID